MDSSGALPRYGAPSSVASHDDGPRHVDDNFGYDATPPPSARRTARSSGGESELLATAGRQGRPATQPITSRFSRIANRLGFDPNMFVKTAADSPPRKLGRSFTGTSSNSSGSPSKGAVHLRGRPRLGSAGARRFRSDSSDTGLSSARQDNGSARQEDLFGSDALSYISAGPLSAR